MKSLLKTLRFTAFAVAIFYIYRHIALLLLRGGRRGDLDILLVAGQRFWNEEPVYLLADDSEHTKPPLLNPLLALLSRLPTTLIHGAWDILMLLLPGLVLYLWTRTQEQRLRWFPAAAALAIMGPLWFSESGYGQYNLLLLALTLFALNGSQNLSLARRVKAGALFWFTLVLKPTQLLFFPLLILGLKKPRFGIWLGLGVGALATGAIYLAFRSFPQLLADLTEWRHFIQESQAKHLLRSDNFGLPTQLARYGFSIAQSPWITLVGLALSTGASLFIRNSGQRIHTIVLITLIFSPMSWRQNYIMLLPLAYDLIVRLEKLPRLFSAWLGVLALVILARFNEHWLGSTLERWWGFYSGPALAAVVALLSYTAGFIQDKVDQTRIKESPK